MILQSFKLDVIPDGKKKEIWLNQYDDDFVLQITLFSSAGTLSIPSGTTAAIRGTKPDGNGYSANAVLSDNVVTVTGDQQMTVVAGKAIFEITLYNDNKELNTANFILHIERAALDKDTPTSRSQTRELVEIEEHAEELIQAAEDINEKASDSEAYAVGTRGGVAVESGDEAYHNNAKYFAEISGNVASNFAPEYDATSTYSAGDLVVYENRLYQCNENIDTAEAWNSAHWTGVTIGSELKGLSNDLNNAVRYDTIQTKTEAEKARARQNIGVSKPAEIIAETFDSAKSYVIGDYVIYNEVLYRFSKTHPAGAWDADDVSEVRIADVVEDISELISDGSDFTPIPFSISDFTYTEHGITRVQSAENGTIQVSGTADMNVSLPIKGENNTNVGFALTAGETYRLSGCPSSGSSSKYGLDLRRTIVGTIDFVDYGDGRVFTPSVSAVYYLHIRIVAGNPVNLTFAPVMEETAVGTSANDKVARKRLKDVTIVSDPGSEIPKVTTQYAMATNDEVGQLSRVWYQVREDEEFDGIRRDDGEYMFPMAGQGNLFSPNAPYHKIMRVMKTYIGNNNLVYGNDNTMGDETCTNEIDCSTFVTAVLNGVTYNHSRHVLGSDHQNIIDPDPGDTLMRYDAITGWRRLVTQQMAQWFARRGKLYKLPLNSQQAAAMLQFGDVLFSANPAGVDLKPYYQIRHCQLVLNTFPENGIVVVAQAGESVDNYVRNEQSVCNTSVIRLNADTIGYYRVFGRPSYGSDDTVIPKITAGNNNEQVFHPRFRLFAFVNNSTGEFAYAKTWAATYEYYPVEGGATITYTGEATDSEQANTAYIAWVAEYNTNKEFIKSTIFTSTPVMLDTDTRFVRFSFGHNASQDKTVHVTSLDDFGAKMTI